MAYSGEGILIVFVPDISPAVSWVKDIARLMSRAVSYPENRLVKQTSHCSVEQSQYKVLFLTIIPT